MKLPRTVPALLAGVLVAVSVAACSLANLDGLQQGESSGDGGRGDGGAGAAASAGSGAGSTVGSGASSSGPQGSGGSVAVGGGSPASSSAQTTGTGPGCTQICNPGETTYVDCNACYKKPQTCSSDGCSVSDGECNAYQCQADQICPSGQCCFGDGHSCDNAGQCCGGTCAGGFCYSCKPYGEPCSSDGDCCPGAPYCEGTCVGN